MRGSNTLTKRNSTTRNISYTNRCQKQKQVNSFEFSYQEKYHMIEELHGLSNLGNTCYMNSVLQCLLSLPLFINSLKTTESEVLENFRKFTQQNDPMIMKKMMGEKYSQYKSYNQQDAHEWIMNFINYIHDENKIDISPLFFGELEVITTFEKCGHSTIVLQQFLSLQLSLKAARRVLYVPYLINSSLCEENDLPNSNCIIVGRDKEGIKFNVQISPKYSEIFAMELPDFYNKETIILNPTYGFALIVMRTTSNISVSTPILVKVPLNDNSVNVQSIVLERIKDLWYRYKQDNIKFMIENGINSFSLSSEKPMCNEIINVILSDQMIETRNGFNGRRTSVNPVDFSLDELIEAYTRETQIIGGDTLECEQCHQKSCTYSRNRIVKIPKIFILKFERCWFNGDVIQRDNSKIFLPPKYNYLSKNYELRGIISHFGTQYFGHYTARGKRGNHWYNFNDRNVTQISEPMQNSETCIALYQLMTNEEDDIIPYKVTEDNMNISQSNEKNSHEEENPERIKVNKEEQNVNKEGKNVNKEGKNANKEEKNVNKEGKMNQEESVDIEKDNEQEKDETCLKRLYHFLQNHFKLFS
ncbi:hypothetical protein TRFO_07258 [Tritrichomonas foetus]|uniref:Ubiquitin carboxyl-terminal hydrolase n=1 Tax=Tritrichomonas foetus TaxID=1144522 RepID=A0A1J4JX14_9EUKA|nr:hypothetical protein TRFO_07258 [Tritrichomonas foetus]|eukprot:OHT02078.1 hypothetical protein TRFO_07258 [Tritrichomonas foetus]